MIEAHLLLGILRIACDFSDHGRHLSLGERLERSNYRSIRGRFTAADLLPLLRANPDLVEQWLKYSEEKRTTGGFWVKDNPIAGGGIGAAAEVRFFPSIEEAVAQFLAEEVDFWFEVGRTAVERQQHPKLENT